MQQIFRAVVRDREEQEEAKNLDGDMDSKASVMITYPEFQKTLLRVHLVLLNAQSRTNEGIQGKPPIKS